VSEPRYVAVVGDVHANAGWLMHQVPLMAGRLSRLGERSPVFLQLGDMGYYPRDPDGFTFLETVAGLMRVARGTWLFIDGNHEDHEALAGVLGTYLADLTIPVFGDRVRWIPRGIRWTWQGRQWLALGGAHSLDRDLLEKGSPRMAQGWFPGESITAEQAELAAAGGHADVMVTHDCPSAVTLALPPPYPAWLGQIPAAEAHRDLLQAVVEDVRPAHLMHGHYHRLYSRPVRMGYGQCRVAGLACDGMEGNWVVLDVRNMRWLNPGN